MRRRNGVIPAGSRMLGGGRGGMLSSRGAAWPLFGRGGMKNAPFIIRGDGSSLATGANALRMNSAVQCDNGTIVMATQELTSAASDQSSTAILISRSTDGGKSWTVPVRVVTEAAPGTHHTGNACLAFDPVSRKVLMIYRRNRDAGAVAADCQIFATSSSDFGATWAAPTDITTAAVVRGAGDPVGHNFPATAWFDAIPGPSPGIYKRVGAGAGGVFFAFYRRTSSAGAPWVHVIKTTDGGATYSLVGGVDQTNVANDGSLEPCILERNNGDLVMNCRENIGGLRGQTVSTDGGVTWSVIAKPAALTQWFNTGTQGSMVKLGNRWCLLNPSHTAERQTMKVWWSTDEGVTWSAAQSKVLFWAYCGYSAQLPIGPSTVLFFHEQGFCSGDTGFARQIAQGTYSLAWLDSTEPDYALLHFNERLAGQKAIAGDAGGTTLAEASIIDHGPLCVNAQPLTFAAAPTYIAGESSVALSLTAGADHVQLAPANNNFYKCDGTTSFTLELRIRTTAISGTIFATRTAAPRAVLDLDGAGKLRFLISFDGVTIDTITSTAAWNDGNWHSLVVRCTRGGTIELRIDGAAAATPVADRNLSAVDTSSVSATCLGQLSDGTVQGVFDIEWLRFTRGAVPDSKLLPAGYSASKATLATVPTYPNSPASIAGCKLWLPGFTPGLFYADPYVSVPLPSTAISSYPAHSGFDRSPDRWFFNTISMNQHPRVHLDPTVGPMWSVAASGAFVLRNSNGTDNPAANFDFIQNAGIFTLAGFYYFDSAGGAVTMTIFDNNNRATAQNGFDFVFAGSLNSLQLFVTANSLTRFNGLTSNGTVLPNTLYHIAVTCAGPGLPVNFYITPATASVIAAPTSPGSFAAGTVAFPTATGRDLTLGAQQQDGLLPLYGRRSEDFIANTAASVADLQKHFDHGKAWASRNLV